MKLSDAMAVEQEWCERKSALGGYPTDLWQTISAFANTEGGKIFLGMDNSGSVVGLNNAQLDAYQLDTVSLCTSGFFNEKVYPRVTILEDAPVVCIEIMPMPHNKRPLFSVSKGLPGGAYVRIGSSNVQCDAEWIRRFALAANGGAELEIIESLNASNLSTSKLSSYRNAVERSNPGILSQIPDDRLLRNCGAVDENGRVTLLGLLRFGEADQIRRHAPHCKVVFAHYRGTQKVDQRTGESIQVDDKEFVGDLSEQFSRVLQYLRSVLPMGARISSGSGLRREEYSVPLDAIREVLANAIVHRDFSDRGGFVLIEMYDDRIEFSNPGRSLVPLNELASHPPASRNPLMMTILRDEKIVEQRGRGIPIILASMERANLPRPHFKHVGNSFVAVLTSPNFLSPIIISWLERFTDFGLNKNQQCFLAHLKANGNAWMGNEGYRTINHLEHNQSLASRELAQLVTYEIIESNDKKNRGAKYRLRAESL